MEHADSTMFSKKNNPDVHIMKGNVVFWHNNVYFHCDSAYFYAKDNLLEAFNDICIKQGDTLFIYGDHLIYEGNTGLVKIHGNVRINNRNITLLTNNFNYDRNINLGYFFDGGMLIDSLKNELTSIYGQYSFNTKIADFRNDVKLKSSQFALTSDILKYNTINKTVIFLKNSTIESDSITIQSSNGWYNTKSNESIFYNRSILLSKDKTKTLTADTLFYNHKTGFGKALGHMILTDIIKKEIIMGNYAYYDKLKGIGFITDSAKFIKYLKKDSLFLHADTFQIHFLDKQQKILKAFYHVRIYKENLQAICDSLHFNSRDSILDMYKNPILWNTNYQVSGDVIKVFLNDTVIDKINILNRVFIIEKKGPTYFNQIKGNNLTAFFTKGQLFKINLDGNTESIYFFSKNQGIDLIGRNKTISAYMTIYIKDYKPIKIWLYPDPKAEILSISNLSYEQKFLKDFVNYDSLRPKNKDDIFTFK